ncbi:MAG: hypothetical protein ACD_41C00264G0006 [uncultured bacterium]|nr:MAG: hypothetical protein ACD_41C00264G0006 [uncultured bacterium]HBY73203.1 hypothetical protein [Candidatus Kerfeldbacteria bacterium]
MQPNEAKQRVEELMGRLDAVRGEIAAAQREVEKFSSQNLIVEAREAQADQQRLEARKRQLENELSRLKKYW